LLAKGVITYDKVWKAYISNLTLVLGFVKSLLPALKGQICITSDHGNSFGYLNLFYGHPENTFIPPLIEVPWLEVSKDMM
jgi:hypothetical protein